MTTFTAVVTSHANEKGLRFVLGQLKYQTRPPDETIVFYSDTPGAARLREHFPEAEFLERPNRDDWGHDKRAEGLLRAASDWVGWFNDDDTYDRTYLEKMLAAGELGDVVYCGWNTKPDCRFVLGSSTSGNFIVKTATARYAGYPEDRVYETDGLFINRIAAVAPTVVRVSDVLYWHNQQP